MPIANPTHVGVAKTTGGVSATNTLTSASFTPTGLGMYAIAAGIIIHDGGGAPTVFSVTGDTHAGTGSWNQTSIGVTSAGDASYSLRLSLLLADVGATPGAGTITVTRTAGSLDQIFWADFLWLTGAGTVADVIALNNKVASRTAGASAGARTLPVAPAATSLVLGTVMPDVASATNTITPPAGWTEAVESFDASFLGALEVAWKNLSAVQGPSWGYTGSGASEWLGAAVEIPVAAAAGGILAPKAYLPTAAVQQASNW